MELAVLFVSFLLLLLMGLPIAFTLSISSLLTVLYMGMSPLVVFQKMASGMGIFALIAIPFFVFSGEIMRHGGIATRLVKLANDLVGHRRGGLSLVNILSSMLFGGLSGSAVADASALGSTLIPMMAKEGYDKEYAVSVTVTAATTGVVIPPSHNMILYSIAAGGTVSVSALFYAGVFPGILCGLLLMICSYIIAVKRNYPARPFPGYKRLALSFLDALPGLFTAVIIVGGVLGGIFTATESAVAALFYGLAVTLFFYRAMTWPAFKETLLSSMSTTATVLFVIGSASAFGWLLALHQVPALMFDFLGSFSSTPFMVFLLINIILLILGTFMDMAPLIAICTPIFLPILKSLGMDPVQFGIILMLNLGIGLVTPPVGSVLFVGCGIAGSRIESVMKFIWPFYLAMVVNLLLVTYFPFFSMFLPNLLK